VATVERILGEARPTARRPTLQDLEDAP
jgi:hypothetical protein